MRFCVRNVNQYYSFLEYFKPVIIRIHREKQNKSKGTMESMSVYAIIKRPQQLNRGIKVSLKKLGCSTHESPDFPLPINNYAKRSC